MPELTKAAKRAMREMATVAYGRQLTAELNKVRRKFEAWDRGEIDAFELEQVIHRFHNGTARTLFNRYNSGGQLDHIVAAAVLDGILEEDEIPEAAREQVQYIVDVIRSIA